MNARRASTVSFLALLAGAVAIGIGPIFVRLSEVGAVATAFWRLMLALPFLGIIAARGSEATPISRRDWRPLTVAGLFFAADLAFWHWSIHFTSVANSTLLSNFASVFVVVFGWLVYKHPVTRRFLLAMTVGLAGTCLLVGRDFALEPRALFGDGLALVTAVFYAGYILAIKSLRDRFSTGAIMCASGVISAVVLLPLAWVAGEKILPRTPHGWLMVASLALVSHVLGQTLITYALAKLPAAVASVTLLVQPVTAAVVAAITLREPVAPLQAVGIVLVLIGVAVARREGN